MEELIKTRIEYNKKIFTDDDLKIICENDILILKIYLMGILDSWWAKKWAENKNGRDNS